MPTTANFRGVEYSIPGTPGSGKLTDMRLEEVWPVRLGSDGRNRYDRRATG